MPWSRWEVFDLLPYRIHKALKLLPRPGKPISHALTAPYKSCLAVDHEFHNQVLFRTFQVGWKSYDHKHIAVFMLHIFPLNYILQFPTPDCRVRSFWRSTNYIWLTYSMTIEYQLYHRASASANHWHIWYLNISRACMNGGCSIH